MTIKQLINMLEKGNTTDNYFEAQIILNDLVCEATENIAVTINSMGIPDQVSFLIQNGYSIEEIKERYLNS